MGADLASHDTTPQPRPMHPMKGPMTTQTLRGLAPNQLLHWRGDRATLRHFNPTFRDLMGGALISDESRGDEGLFGYVATSSDPDRTINNSLPTTFNGANPMNGMFRFNAHINHCGVCHTLPTGSDNNVDDLRNFGGRQFMKTPPLQTLYQRALLDTRSGVTNVTGFGLSHDGTGSRHFMPTVHPYQLDELVGIGFAEVSAFLMCFDTGTAPIIGYSRTITALNRGTPQRRMILFSWRRRPGRPIGANSLFVACGKVNRGNFSSSPTRSATRRIRRTRRR